MTYSAREFYIQSQYAFKRRGYEIAAFELHQVVERFYAAILLIFTNYKPRTHDIEKLGHMVSGYKTDLWTLKRVVELIQKHFGVSYDPSGVWHVLRSMGWSCQRPEHRARECDEEAVAAWRRKTWPRLKKEARRSGRSPAFPDESGFMLQPVVRRTWAPKGGTPIQYRWDRHDRLSVLSAVTVSPQRRRLGLYFVLYGHNIGGPELERFIAELLEHLPHGLILVWDRSPVPRSATGRLLRRFGGRLRIEWLPAYAPQLNPDEQVWTQAKYRDLANFLPEDVADLATAVAHSLRRTGTRQPLLRSFFQHAELTL